MRQALVQSGFKVRKPRAKSYPRLKAHSPRCTRREADIRNLHFVIPADQEILGAQMASATLPCPMDQELDEEFGHSYELEQEANEARDREVYEVYGPDRTEAFYA